MLKLPQVVNVLPQFAQAPLPLSAREVRVPHFSAASWRQGGEGEGEPLSARILRKARAGPTVSGHGAQAHHHAADDLPSGVAEALAARGHHTIRYLIEDVPPRPAALAEGAADAADSVPQLRAQLEMSAAVIRELKTVVRVQHAKIEELRLPKELGPKAQLRLLEEFETPSQQPEEAQTVAQLEAQVRRLTNQLKELRARNADLQRVNRRYADMLGQCGQPGTQTGSPATLSFPGGHAESAPESPSDGSSPTPPPALVGVAAPHEAGTPESAGSARSPQHRTSAPKRPVLSSAQPGMDKTSPTALRRNTCEVGFSPVAAARLANVSQLATAIWHEQEPRDVLRALLHGAGKMVDGTRCVVNLYLADPWLRSVMAEPSGGGGGAATVMKPTVFYLEGKVTVHAFRRDGLRADPPRFADLASLPILTSTTVMALPLQAAVFRPVLAVLQVTALPSGSNARAEDASPRNGASPAEASSGGLGSDLTGVSPSQATGLQLLCSTASGILDLRRRIESVRAGQGRARECLRMAMEVHGVQSLSDFESRAKILVTRFFNVATSRICFYDAKEQELICTTMRGHHSSDQSGGAASKHRLVVGRRTLARFSTREGIVGRCVRKQVVFNLERVVSSPFISESADGLDISGRGGEVNMMAGPMVAHFADGTSQVVGVLQVIEKRKRAADDPLAALERSESSAGPAFPAAAAAASGTRASMAVSALGPTGSSGAGAAGAASTCEAFTDEDEDFFRELLRLLGQALHRTVQALYPQGAAAEGGLANILTRC